MAKGAITFFVVVAGLILIAPLASAQLSSDDAKQLELKYKGKFVRVRDLVSDSKVRYDANGNLVGKWHAGQWTWHSTVEVTKIDVKDRLLRIKANRLLLNYNRGKHLFAPVRAGEVEFEVETSRGADGKTDLPKEFSKAFLTENEDYPFDMQPYWKPFISCIRKPDTDECRFYEKKSWEPDVYNLKPASTWKPSYPGVQTVGPGVKPPKVKSRIEPQYTDIARNAKISGTVLLEAIVRKTGAIEIIRVIRPLGFGLEENAADALGQWVFEPGTRMGEPVDVYLNIEINFQLR